STRISTPAGIIAIAASSSLGLLLFQSNATGQRGQTSLLADVDFPVGNEFSEEKRVLGKILFFDEQLSVDNTVSCATCHQSFTGGADPRLAINPGPDGIAGTDDDIQGSPGVIAQDAETAYDAHPVFGLGRQVTGRTANPVINAAYPLELFWDGRSSDVLIDPETDEVVLAGFAALENQVLGPPLSEVEMGHADRDWPAIAAKLAHARPMALGSDLPPDMEAAVLDAQTYPELFERAFGDPDINPVRIAMAIATYERTLIADQTPWDAFVQGDSTALTAAEARGWLAFQTEFCTLCHIPPLFTDQSFRNIGLRPIEEDIGRQAVTGDFFDRGKFKTPGLRNSGLKRTFMHNGAFTTMAEVIDFYAGDDHFLENIDGFIPGIFINQQDRADIAQFVETGLTDPRVANEIFPFDQPDLFFAPGNQPNPSLLPGPGVPDSQGNVPRIIAMSPPLIGDDGFKVGVGNVADGATVTLVASTAPPVAGEVAQEILIGTYTASDPDGIEPSATAFWPIPFSPALDGQVYFLQWRVDDPAQAQPALSRVARVEFLCGFGDCETGCLADYNRDQLVNFFDIADFIAGYNAQDRNADIATPIGAFNFFDIADFIAAYNAGCP
ncbi:MAG: cytochrome c peroxidase, partial [Planctomycetota bacterium]